MGKRTRF